MFYIRALPLAVCTLLLSGASFAGGVYYGHQHYSVSPAVGFGDASSNGEGASRMNSVPPLLASSFQGMLSQPSVMGVYHTSENKVDEVDAYMAVIDAFIRNDGGVIKFSTPFPDDAKISIRDDGLSIYHENASQCTENVVCSFDISKNQDGYKIQFSLTQGQGGENRNLSTASQRLLDAINEKYRRVTSYTEHTDDYADIAFPLDVSKEMSATVTHKKVIEGGVDEKMHISVEPKAPEPETHKTLPAPDVNQTQPNKQIAPPPKKNVSPSDQNKASPAPVEQDDEMEIL